MSLGEKRPPWGRGPTLQYLSSQFCLLLDLRAFHLVTFVAGLMDPALPILPGCLLYHTTGSASPGFRIQIDISTCAGKPEAKKLKLAGVGYMSERPAKINAGPPGMGRPSSHPLGHSQLSSSSETMKLLCKVWQNQHMIPDS